MSSCPFAVVHVGNCILFIPEPASLAPNTYMSYPFVVRFLICTVSAFGASLSIFVTLPAAIAPYSVPFHIRAYIVPFELNV